MSMRVSGGGPRGSRIGGSDEQAQRALNANAPRVANLGRRVAQLFRPYSRGLTVTIVLVVVVAAISVFPPLLTREIFDEALFPADGSGVDTELLVRLGALMVALLVVSAALNVWQTYLTASVGNRVMGDLRMKLFAHLQRVDLEFFTRTKTGVIQSRLQNDVGGVAQVLSNTVSSVVGNVVTVAAALVSMLLLSWQLTLISIAILPPLVWVQRRVGQVRARIATQTQESMSEMTAMTQESLGVQGILLSRLFNRSDDETQRYGAENRRQIGLQVRQAMTGQWFFALVGLFVSALPVVVYLVAGFLISDGSSLLSAGTVVAFTTVQARLLNPMMGLLRMALDLQTSAALFARIFEYLDLRPTITDPSAPHQMDPARSGEVTFDSVTFRYPDMTDDVSPILDGVTFVAEPGEFVAFVGASGAGKSTIAALIPRLYDVSSGSVAVAGVDVRELRQIDLREAIGMVSQETYLHHDTIEANLRFANPQATIGQIEAAARDAAIHDRILSFPQGYATVVGQQGYRLSGGERQRIAIARVLLKNPSILVLDEATSALDTESERIVQRAIEAATHGRTTLAIAHRLSTIVHADVIHVVNEGRIVESGTHAQLRRAGGPYQRLFEQQEN